MLQNMFKWLIYFSAQWTRYVCRPLYYNITCYNNNNDNKGLT